MVNIETITYEGWENCLRVTNGVVELVATTAVGPRIVHFGFVDGRNELFVPDETGAGSDEEWKLHGGHRLWHAPEDETRTLVPDNDPIDYEITDDGVVLTQPTEELTGMIKEMVVQVAADEPVVELTHRITNDGVWPVAFAPWAITVFEPGGKAVVPLPEGDHDELLPDRSLALWPYTDPSDDRLEWVENGLLVRQDEGEQIKVGASGNEEWTAYVNDGHAVVKQFPWDPGATYPDYGCGVEVFTVPYMLELETLGPLRTVDPGDTAEHVERWTLHDEVSVPETGPSLAALDPT